MNRRARVTVVVVAFAVILVAAIATVTTLSLNKTLDESAVEGDWHLDGEQHSIEIVLNSDGSFVATEWPINLGCQSAPWPSRLAEITWERTVPYEGTWSISEINGKSVTLVGDTEGGCSISALHVSPALGDDSLRMYLDLTGEPVELVFSRDAPSK